MSDSPQARTDRWHHLRRWLPILSWLPSYRRERLRGDVVAGAIVASLLIPQSLGYAEIAGVPVQVGLYAVPLALLAYAVLGSSPQLVVGPASTVAIVSGSLVADLGNGDPRQAMAVTAALAVATGIVLVTLGLLRLAWIAEFLSKPIVTGFVFGLTLTIVIGELPTLLGIDKPPGDLLGVLVRTLARIDQAQPLTAVIGGTAVLVLFGGARLAPRIPWGLITVVVAVAASSVAGLVGRGVATIGDVPTGLPPFGIPLVSPSQLGAIALGGISLALVALAEGLAATRLFASRGGYRVETERELIGMGGANIASGLSGGLAVAGSLSKTAAANQAGGASQVTGITSAGLTLIVLIALAWFFEDLPSAVLSAIVVAAVWNLMDVSSMRRYRLIRTADFAAATVAAAGVVLFGPLPGLGIAIAISLLAIIYRAAFPRIEVLGKISDEKAAWGRIRKHPNRKPVSGVVVARLDAPLFWVNATAIEDRLLAELDDWPDTRALVLNLEATTRLDTTTADVLTHLLDELQRRDVALYLARVLHPVHAVLTRAGFIERLGEDHIWHSISQAVRAARRDTGLKAGTRRAGAEAAPPVAAAADGGGSPATAPTDGSGEAESLDDSAPAP
ncbi:MAG TPA: sulfate permease [Euzebyales bacterium]